MKFCFRFISALTVSLLLVSPVYSQDQPTPEERAYEFRHGLFETFGWKLGQLAGAKAKGDETAFVKHANDLAFLSTLLEEGFQIENSLPEGTRAKPEIWQDYATFKEKAQTLNEAATALTESGAMKGFDIQDFGSKICGGCHKKFRLKEES